MEQILKDTMEELLRETAPLSEMAAPSDSKFINVILGVYRISLSTLRDIYYLAHQEDTGLNILDLSRKIVEHGIAIEYIMLKGKEKMAAQFQDYLWVQTHQELNFLKTIGEIPENWNSELKTGAVDAEELYNKLSSGMKNNTSWAGINFETMLKELHESNFLQDFDYSRIAQIYVWGCRANHPNPFMVIKYMGEKEHKPADVFHSRLGIVAAMLFHIQLTKRYIGEIHALGGENSYQELSDKVTAIWGKLDGLKNE